jgi:hypothetical protein
LSIPLDKLPCCSTVTEDVCETITDTKIETTYENQCTTVQTEKCDVEYNTKCETVTECTGGQQDETYGGGTGEGATSGGVSDFYGVPLPPQVSKEYLLVHRKCSKFFLAVMEHQAVGKLGKLGLHRGKKSWYITDW